VTEVYPPSSSNGAGGERLFSATMCIPKNRLYESIGDLRKVRSALGDDSRVSLGPNTGSEANVFHSGLHETLANQGDAVLWCADRRQRGVGATHDIHI